MEARTVRKRGRGAAAEPDPEEPPLRKILILDDSAEEGEEPPPKAGRRRGMGMAERGGELVAQMSSGEGGRARPRREGGKDSTDRSAEESGGGESDHQEFRPHPHTPPPEERRAPVTRGRRGPVGDSEGVMRRSEGSETKERRRGKMMLSEDGCSSESPQQSPAPPLEAQDSDCAWYDIDIVKVTPKGTLVRWSNVSDADRLVDPRLIRKRSVEAQEGLRGGETVIAFQEREEHACYFDATIIAFKPKHECDDGRVYQVRWDASAEEGKTEWLSLHHLFISDRKSTMTTESLSALFPHLVTTPAARVKPEEDMVDLAFLEKWIKTASIPEEIKAIVKSRLKFGRMTGVIEEIVWWRKVEGAPSDDINACREFKVKFVGLSFRRCQWFPRKVAVHLADQKVFHFERRNGLGKGGEVEEVAEEDSDDDADFFEGIRAEWLQVDRIVYEDEQTKALLVKWQGLGYERANWEYAADLQLESDVAKIDYYRACMQRYREKATKAKRAKRGQHPSSRAAGEECDLLSSQPSFLKGGTLFGYQVEGVNWLRRKRGARTNVILADEMGLGKTVQIVSLLACIKNEEGATSGPFLVVVPLSTLPNWRNELERWAPQLNAIMYAGCKEAREIIRDYEFDPDGRSAPCFDVLCTTYEVALQDANMLSRIDWDCMVVDEGHRLKNDKSLLFGALARFTTQQKILLTGTPLQNNLQELFNLLAFLTKHDTPEQRFPSAEQFDKDVKGVSVEERIKHLHELLSPYILRRLKQDQNLELLPRIERTLFVGLTAVQKEFYVACLTNNYKMLIGKEKTGRPVSFRHMLMHLRKCCLHAYLFDSAIPSSSSKEEERALLVGASSKLQCLEQLLPALKAAGHRVLIFSQFTSMLDILETYLHGSRHSFLRIDGNVGSDERQRRIDAFNDPDSKIFIFLLSTRAGGLGINLATADTVIIYDSDYNPHRDIQALSRVHRIGQRGKVLVLRLITKASVEEKIISIAQQKMALEGMVVNSLEEGDKKKSAGFSLSEMQEILRHGAAEVLLTASTSRVWQTDKKGTQTTLVDEETQGDQGNGDVGAAHVQAAETEDLGAEGGRGGTGGEGDKQFAKDHMPREVRGLQEETRTQEKMRLAREATARQAPALQSSASSYALKLSAEELHAILDRSEGSGADGDGKGWGGSAGGVLQSFKIDEGMRHSTLCAEAQQSFGVTSEDPPAVSSKDFWAKLLSERAAEREEETTLELGKGKRARKKIGYYASSLLPNNASDRDEDGGVDEGESSGEDSDWGTPHHLKLNAAEDHDGGAQGDLVSVGKQAEAQDDASSSTTSYTESLKDFLSGGSSGPAPFGKKNARKRSQLPAPRSKKSRKGTDAEEETDEEREAKCWREEERIELDTVGDYEGRVVELPEHIAFPGEPTLSREAAKFLHRKAVACKLPTSWISGTVHTQEVSQKSKGLFSVKIKGQKGWILRNLSRETYGVEWVLLGTTDD